MLVSQARLNIAFLPDSPIFSRHYEINISEDAIEWENEDYKGKPRWRIKCQDDNGNTFVVAKFFKEEHAQSICNYLDKKGHKQTYQV